MRSVSGNFFPLEVKALVPLQSMYSERNTNTQRASTNSKIIGFLRLKTLLQKALQQNCYSSVIVLLSPRLCVYRSRLKTVDYSI